jgi:hypothetical protein
MRNAYGALIIVLLFVGAAFSLAAPARTQELAASPALAGLPGYKTIEARYPGSDGVVLFDSLVITLDKDNHIAKRRHRAVMLFTDNAINRYGDPRILFNSATQELSVITARVYMRDGTIVDTRKNGINQTTPFALDHAPDYADWQETVVTHVGIEKGCVAELHYRIRDKEPSPWLSGVDIFSSEDPVEVRVLEIGGPGASNLKSASLNGAPAAAKTPDGVSWTVRDIAGRTPFDGGAWEGDCFPTVCYSTAASWPDVLSKIRAGIIEESRSSIYFASIVGEATKDMFGEDKMLAIHRLALDRVSSVRAPFGLFAAAPRDAQRIYESGYASPLDRAVLLMAMLEAGGFHPMPVLVSAGTSWTDEAAAPEIFNAVFVFLMYAGPHEEPLFVDPGVAYEHHPVIAGRTLAYLDEKPSIAHDFRGGGDGSRLDLVLKPGADGSIAGSGTAVLTGLFSPYYLMKGSGSEAEDFVKARVHALFNGAELTSWNPQAFDKNRVEIAFTFTVKMPDGKPGERVYLTVPRSFDAALSGMDRVRVERSLSGDGTAMVPCRLKVSCTIDPPKGWKIISLPAESAVKNEVGEAAVSVESTPDGTKICKRTLVFDSALVRPADYAKLRALLLAFGEDRLVLERE